LHKKVENMKEQVQIHYEEIEENHAYEETIHKVIQKCFEEENLFSSSLYINIILTNPSIIRSVNKEYRNIDKETDVLSFPMFEKEELEVFRNKQSPIPEVLGDIMISIPRVKEQAIEYGHSFERELAYMVVHGFYHVMGYDHIEEADKQKMRPKEEHILAQLNITRD